MATRLLISISHTYRCQARTEMLARVQHAIPLTVPRSAAQLGPWRRRATRVQQQLAFDFEGQLLAGLR